MSKSGYQISIPSVFIDASSSITKSQQLYNQLRQAILKRHLVAGQRLPPSRLFAKETGVSRNTVLEVFEQLKREGYLIGETGSGTYISSKLPEDFFKGVSSEKNKKIHNKEEKSFVPAYSMEIKHGALQRNTAIEQARTFQSGMPALYDFPFTSWSKLAAKVLRGFMFEHIGYDEAAGHRGLRETIASYLTLNRAVNCSAENIVITSGAQQALCLLSQVLLQKGDGFWMEDPGYIGARIALSFYGGLPCSVPITDQGMDIDYAMAHYPNAKVAYVTPSHQYPYGVSMPLFKRLELLHYAQKKNLYIIEDDYDNEFRYAGKPIPSLQGLDKKEKVIYMGTFSKVLFPALRIGYLVLPNKKLFDAVRYLKAMTDRQNPILDQLILNEFMKEGYYSRHVRKMRISYREKQELMIAQFNKYDIGLTLSRKPESGMQLVVNLPKGYSDQAVAAELKKINILSAPLSDYTFEQKVKPGLLLGFAGFTPKQIIKGVGELCEVIRKMKNPTSK